jgi:hypothetical protein
MYVEKSLIAEARKRINGQRAERVAYVESVIERWERACLLSRGKIDYRNKHWQGIAEDLRTELEAIAGRKFAIECG